MKETSRFIIQHHKTPHPHIDLTLETDEGIRSWIVPGGIPEKEKEQKIAIEEPGEKKSIAEVKDELTVDGYGEGVLETWDEGPYRFEAKNRIKFIISAGGMRFKGKFLLHNPGWGRWTKKKLWVLEKVSGK